MSDPIEDHEEVESDRRMASTFLGLIAISIPIAGAVLYFATAGRRAFTTAPSPAAVEQPATPPEPAPQAAEPPQTPAASPEPNPAAGPAAPPTAPAAAATERAAAATPAATSAPAATPPVPADDRFTVVLSVKRPCWVSATVDGEHAIERLLQPGEQQTIEVRREMVLTAGDAGAIAMTLNGADARPLGKSGEVVTARLNMSNLKDYLATR